MSSLYLDTLRHYNIIRQQEWDTGASLTPEYFGNALAGEVGEACNIIKKIARERLNLVGSRATPEQLAEELADVVIYVDLIAAQFKINLGQAIVDKFNATSDRYGLNTRIK